MTQSGKACLVGHSDIDFLCGTSLFHAEIANVFADRGLSCHYISPAKVDNYRFDARDLCLSLKRIFGSTRLSQKRSFSQNSANIRIPFFRKKFRSLLIGNCSNVDFFFRTGTLEQRKELLDLDFIYTSLGNISSLQIVRKLIAMNPRAQLIIHFYDDWIGTTNTSGFLGYTHGWLIQKIIGDLAKRAHRIVAISPRLAHLLELRFARNVDILFRWPTKELLEFANQRKNKRSGSRPVTITYVGSVSAHSQHRTIMKFLQALGQSNESDIQMDIYTDPRLFFKNSHFRCFSPPVNNFMYFSILAQTDWVLIPAPTEPKYNYISSSIPAKIWHCIFLATRILYVGSFHTEQAELLRSFGARRVNQIDEHSVKALLDYDLKDQKPSVQQVRQRLTRIAALQQSKLIKLLDVEHD